MKSVKYVENNEYLAYSVLTSISIAVTYSELVLVLDNFNKNTLSTEKKNKSVTQTSVVKQPNHIDLKTPQSN